MKMKKLILNQNKRLGQKIKTKLRKNKIKNKNKPKINKINMMKNGIGNPNTIDMKTIMKKIVP